MCAINPIAFRTSPRPDLFTTVFFAIFLGELWAYQREYSRRLWLLPFLMVLWVNFHPGFILGLAAIGAYLLIETSELLFRPRRADALHRLRTAWPWLAGTAVATLLNPWGVKLYTASFALAGLNGQKPATFSTLISSEEFQPYKLSFHLVRRLVDLRYHENGFLWLMLIAVLVIALALWRRQIGVALVQGAVLYLAIQHVRFIGLFCVATTIIGSTLLGEAFTTAQQSTEGNEKGNALFHIPPSFALAFLFVIGSISALHAVDFITNRTHVVYATSSRFGLGESPWFPERAASFIKREQLPGNVFQEYETGGFTAWRLGPEYLDFVDGRNVDGAVVAETQKLVHQQPDSVIWQDAANRWGINVLLIAEAVPGAEAPIRQDAMSYCQSNRWRPVYMDEVSLVLLRNVPQNQPWIDRFQINCRTQEFVPPASASRKDLYDFYINAGGMLSALHRDRESETELLQASALYPEDPNAHFLLGKLYQRNMVFDRAESEYRASLTLDDNEGSWAELGIMYMQQTRLPEAAHAFSAAIAVSDDPFEMYRGLAQAELLMHHPEAALKALDGAAKSSPYRNGGESTVPQIYAELADLRADAYGMLPRIPLAIEWEQESLRLNPGVPARWNKLAYLLEATGQSELSRQARRRAAQF
jgi:tetratricopeptide (TPR) repeat protein